MPRLEHPGGVGGNCLNLGGCGTGRFIKGLGRFAGISEYPNPNVRCASYKHLSRLYQEMFLTAMDGFCMARLTKPKAFRDLAHSQGFQELPVLIIGARDQKGGIGGL